MSTPADPSGLADPAARRAAQLLRCAAGHIGQPVQRRREDLISGR